MVQGEHFFNLTRIQNKPLRGVMRYRKMFSNKVPKFSNGNILKGEMLQNINRYSENFIESYFGDYSNGIISGADLSVEENHIIIAPGIIKNRDKIYVQKEVCRLEYVGSGRETIIKLRFIDSSVGSGFTSSCGEAFLDDDLEMKRDEFELGRFNIKKGFLSTNYKSLGDLQKQSNINIVNAEYAHIGESTLNPLILELFAKEMLDKNSKKVEDKLFLLKCLRSKTVGKQTILNYTKVKNSYSNKDIYEALLKISRGRV